MPVLLATVAVTAIIVGAAAVWATRARTNARLVAEMGGRKDADPIVEHRRLLNDAVQAATAADERGDLLRLSLNALSSGVIVTDGSGEVIVRNRLADDTALRSHEQTLVDAAAHDLLAAAVQGRSAEREVNIFGPPPRTLLLQASPVSADGQVVGALAVIDDVTDNHRIEKTRRDFVANLSHELRTPVGAASLLGEMLVDESDADVRQQLTDRLLVETDRMATTIDDLLELSRIESAEQSYAEQVEIEPVVDEALARTRVAAETKNVEVTSQLPQGSVSITGNRDQLLTAVVNLVENAIKYSSSGDSVTVRAEPEADGLRVAVRDTGRGIPARDLDRIFERFYRVDRSRDSATGGTGIGLSIVRHVALNHGGEVHVDSFEGEGSTFTMVLPFETAGKADHVDER